MGFYILIFMLIFAGLHALLRPLFGIPSKAAVRNARAQTEKRLPLKRKLYNAFIRPIVRAVASLIRMKPDREREMGLLLKRAGMQLTPREFRAKAFVDAALSLLISVIVFLAGLHYMLPVTLIVSVLFYFRSSTSLNEALKEKKERIEASLPGFIRAILYKLEQNRSISGDHIHADLIEIFEDYLRIAKGVFHYDVSVLVTEMKSMDIPSALRNFSDRISLPEVTFLTNALIGIHRGENQNDTLRGLAKDMDIKARENIRRELDKRPGKVRLAIIPMAILAIVCLFYVIITSVLVNMGGLLS